MKKVFAGIVAVDEARRTVTVESAPLDSPGEFERERDALADLAGREVIGRDWGRPSGAVLSVAFPTRREEIKDQQTGDEKPTFTVVATGVVRAELRIDDAAEWEKVVAGVYVGVDVGPRAVGLVDNPEAYVGTNKLAKLACARAAGRASARAAAAPILAKMAEVSAMVAALEHAGEANGVPVELRLIGLAKSFDTG